MSQAPLLHVDVNLGPSKQERITIYQGETAEQLANEFAFRNCKIRIHNLDRVGQ